MENQVCLNEMHFNINEYQNAFEEMENNTFDLFQWIYK